MTKGKNKILKILIIVLVGIVLVAGLVVLGINLYVKNSVSDRIITA